MISLRRTALLWMTLLLTLVGASAALIAYRLADDQASEFLDNELRIRWRNSDNCMPV